MFELALILPVKFGEPFAAADFSCMQSSSYASRRRPGELAAMKFEHSDMYNLNSVLLYEYETRVWTMSMGTGKR